MGRGVGRGEGRGEGVVSLRLRGGEGRRGERRRRTVSWAVASTNPTIPPITVCRSR